MSSLDYLIVRPESDIFPSPSVTYQATPEASPQYKLDFASAYVTANHAYSLAQAQNLGTLDTSVPITLFTPNQSSSNYSVIELSSIPDGMHGFILTEVAPISDTVNIKVCFRGVQISDLSSIQRGLELGGPGVNSFIDASEHIMNQLEAVTKQYASVNLEFSGHSLGGADATYAFHDFLYHYLRDYHFQNVEKVTLNSLNAPGHYIDLKDSLSQLLSANKYSGVPLDIAINIAIADSDIVSQLGESPFTDISPDLATVQVCYIDKFAYDLNSTWGEFFSALPDIIKEMVYIAHSLEPIFSPNSMTENELSPNFSYHYHNNQTATDIDNINATLDYKWHITSAINMIADSTNGMMQLSKLAWGYTETLMSGEFDEYYLDLFAALFKDDNNAEQLNMPEYYYQAPMQLEPMLELILVTEPPSLFG